MKRLFFLATLGLLTATAAGTGANAQTTHGPAATAGCSETDFLPNQIRCFLDAAEAEGDVGLCDGAYDFAVRFNCVSLFAEHSGDPVSCERIPIRNNRLLLMRDSCVAGVAAATRMPQLCEQVQLDVVRDACFLTQVVEFNAAPDLCQRITKTAVREGCLAPPASPK
jgi:hypothetical protein